MGTPVIVEAVRVPRSASGVGGCPAWTQRRPWARSRSAYPSGRASHSPISNLQPQIREKGRTTAQREPWLPVAPRGIGGGGPIFVPGRCGVELVIRDRTSEVIDDRGVVDVFVSVDSDENLEPDSWTQVIPWPRAGRGWVDSTAMGLGRVTLLSTPCPAARIRAVRAARGRHITGKTGRGGRPEYL